MKLASNNMPLTIDISNRTRTRIDAGRIREVVSFFYALPEYRRWVRDEKELSLALVGDIRMRFLNRTYRHIDKTTDILSFAGDDSTLGELIICPAQIKRQAARLGNSWQYELYFIIIHGLLHLTGLNDDSEPKRIRMIKKGEEMLEKMKIDRFFKH